MCPSVGLVYDEGVRYVLCFVCKCWCLCCDLEVCQILVHSIDRTAHSGERHGEGEWTRQAKEESSETMVRGLGVVV